MNRASEIGFGCLDQPSAGKAIIPSTSDEAAA